MGWDLAYPVAFNQTLPSMPLGAAGTALTQAMVGSGFWVPVILADYPTVAGKVLKMRLHASFTSGTTGDVYGADFFDGVASAVLIAETTAVAPASANNYAEVLSGWVNVPVSTGAFVRVRNQTAARGNLQGAFLELQYQ